MDIAEEQQAQPLAEFVDAQAVHRVLGARPPLPEGLGQVMVGTQPFEQLSLAQAGRVRGAEQLQQFALGQQAEQLFQRQLTLGIDPALLDQWRCRRRGQPISP